VKLQEGWQVHMALESRFENIEIAEVVVEDSLRRLNCDDDTRYGVRIALREALANAIKHGNHQNPDKKVEVQLAVEESELVIHIVDQGEGFDLDLVDDPLDEKNLLKPNGRGIFYMGKFMDDICYNFLPEGGTELTLRKRINSLSPSSEDQEEDSK